MTVPTITDDLVAELEAAAIEAETQGLWRLVSDDMGNEIDSDEGPVIEHTSFAQDTDMAFIAAANPATIKALLAERAELKRKSRRYDFIRDQHNYEFSDIGVSNGNLFLAREDGELDLDSSIDELMEAMQEQPS